MIFWRAEALKSYDGDKRGSVYLALGVQYRHGLGVEENTEEARSYLEMAAELGNAAAMLNLGYLYDREDDVKAYEWYKKAAQAGSVRAMLELAGLYEEINYDEMDDLVPGDSDHAIIESLKASRSKAVTQDDEKSMYWYSKAADAGDAEAMYKVAWIKYQEKEHEEAISLFERSSENGYADAMSFLGWMYANGWEPYSKRDFDLARKWHVRAAIHGNTESVFDLGLIEKWEQEGVPEPSASSNADRITVDNETLDRIRRRGEEIIRQEIELIKLQGNQLPDLDSRYSDPIYYLNEKYYSEEVELQWRKIASLHGNHEASLALGRMYYLSEQQWGDKHERDDEEAVMWLEEAANSGNAEAMGLLGILYGDDTSDLKDYRKAFQWLLKASMLGDTDSMVLLADAYHLGQGIPENYSEAYAWASVAVAYGERFGEPLRDVLRDQLSAELLASAQQRASELYDEIAVAKEANQRRDEHP